MAGVRGCDGSQAMWKKVFRQLGLEVRVVGAARAGNGVRSTGKGRGEVQTTATKLAVAAADGHGANGDEMSDSGAEGGGSTYGVLLDRVRAGGEVGLAAAEELARLMEGRKGGAEAACAGAEVWGLLPPEIRERCVKAQGDVLVREARACVLSQDCPAEKRRHAVQILRDAGGAADLPYLLGLLSDADPVVGASAAEGLVELTERVGANPQERAEAERVMAFALEAVDSHRQMGVLRGAMALTDSVVKVAKCGERFAGVLEKGGLDADRALFEGIRAGEAGVTAESLWVWCRFGRLADVSAEMLVGSEVGMEAVFGASHLALHPARAEAMGKALSRNKAEMLRGALMRVSVGGNAELMRGAANLALQDAGNPRTLSVREGVAGELAGSVDAADRLNALRLAASGETAGAVQMIRDECFDASEVVAGMGVVVLQSLRVRARMGGEALRELTQQLRRSGHAKVRMIANQQRFALEPTEALWQWPDDVGARVAVRRWLRRDRMGVCAAVQGMLAGWEVVTEDGQVPLSAEWVGWRQMLAMAWCRELGIVDDVFASVVGVLWAAIPADEETGLAVLGADACRALTHAKSEETRGLLREAMTAMDSRVRANAAEAATVRGQCGEPWAEELSRLLADAHHRPRATGAAGLFVCAAERGGGVHERMSLMQVRALGALAEMVRSGERVSVLAGMWGIAKCLASGPIVEPTRWQSLAGEIARLERAGNDAWVSEQAKTLRVKITDRIRADWTEKSVAWGGRDAGDW